MRTRAAQSTPYFDRAIGIRLAVRPFLRVRSSRLSHPIKGLQLAGGSSTSHFCRERECPIHQTREGVSLANRSTLVTKTTHTGKIPRRSTSAVQLLKGQMSDICQRKVLYEGRMQMKQLDGDGKKKHG